MNTNQELPRNERIPNIQRRVSLDVMKGSSKGADVPISQRRLSCDVAMESSNSGLPPLISKQLPLDLAKEPNYAGIPALISRQTSLDCVKEPNMAGIPALISRRTSFDCAKERLENDRSMQLQRRLSLNIPEESGKPRAPLPTHRRVSCDIPKLHTKGGMIQNTKRRVSLDTAKEEPGYAKDWPIRRRESWDIGKRSHLLRSGFMPPTNSEETLGNPQRHDNKLPELSTNDTLKEKLQQRRYTVINAPAQLHVQKKHPLKKQRSQPAFETTVCQLASKMSNTLSFEQEVDKSDARDEINMDVNFVPKPCWCLRCQIMLNMFRNGDKHLEVWGNYPCFRR